VPDITDRPDAALIIDGDLVAIECRTFTSERILRLHGADMPEGQMHQLYLPLEPHIWLGQAIAAKTKKIEDYLNRTGAASVWLIAHSARGMFSHLAELYEKGLADLFRIAAYQTPHGFQRIYLTGECDLQPTCIFNRDSEEAGQDWETYSRKQVISIPAAGYLFAKVTAIEGANGEGQISGSLFRPDQTRIYLQPLDRNHWIDYSELMSIPTEEVAESSSFSVLYSNLKE